MKISSVNSGSFSSVRGNDPISKTKQAFSSLEAALNSGDLTGATNALTQLEKIAPPPGAKNPLSDKVEALGQALSSGDLAAAKDQFAAIKKAIASLEASGPGGKPPVPSFTGSTKAYDPKDADKNGQISIQEELSYTLKNPDILSGGANTQTASGQTQLDSLFDALA